MASTCVGREFEVVRLGPRGREVLHIDGVAADLLRGPRERIEARDHVDATVIGPLGGRAAALTSTNVTHAPAPI